MSDVTRVTRVRRPTTAKASDNIKDVLTDNNVKRRGRKPKTDTIPKKKSMPKKRGRKRKDRVVSDEDAKKKRSMYSIMNTEKKFDHAVAKDLIVYLPISDNDMQYIDFASTQTDVSSSLIGASDLVYNPNILIPDSYMGTDNECIGEPVGSSIGGPVGSSIGGPIGSSIGGPVGSSIGGPVGSSVGSPVGASFSGPVGSSVGSSIRTPVGAQVNTSNNSGAPIADRVLPSTFDTNDRDKWVRKTGIKCFHCTESFNGIPYAIPRKFENGVYHVKDCFCSGSCALAHLLKSNLDVHKIAEMISLLHMLNRDIKGLDEIETIKPAPDREVLIDYGGTLTLEEFRGDHDDTFYSVCIPPMKPIVHKVEEVPLETSKSKPYSLGFAYQDLFTADV